MSPATTRIARALICPDDREHRRARFLADHVGVDFFGIGEHHTDDLPLSAADVVLGVIATRTARIRIGSAVTVLSSDDPVRVFQRYSTLAAVSGGRAEVIRARLPATTGHWRMRREPGRRTLAGTTISRRKRRE
jgi:alkanesulfonate monooxygenase SsuD/methylene tetrahydromethanopterin reductase-like flavin-dependent oxidoreductase (luciferase family)